MNKLRLGIIGPGLIWEHSHEEVLLEMADFYSIAAFCASSEATREKVQATYPDCPFYTDYTEMLKSPDIDAVVILTPIELNAPIAKASIQAGKIVFVEKPFCTTAAEAEALLKLHQQSTLPIFVLEQVVYNPELEKLKKRLAEGLIGRPLFFNAVDHFIMNEDVDLGGFEKTKWRQEPTFPLGTLMDGGIHFLAKISTLLGTPTAVAASGNKLREGYGEYDHISVSLDYENGVTGSLSHSGFLPNKRLFQLYGTEATLIEDQEGLVIQYKDGSEEKIDLDTNHTRNMWQEFKYGLQNNTAPSYTLEQAVGDVKTLAAIGESIKQNSKVSI